MIEERLIHSHTDVVDCFSPSIQLKVSTSARPGRPSLIIGFDEVMFLRSINFSWLNIAQMYGVSRTTIYRKCKEAGILNLEKNQLASYEDLLPVVREIKEAFPDAGERMLSRMLHARNIYFRRDTLRSIIHDIDPINTSLRWNAKIARRTYSVPGPNSLWHIGMY